MSDATSPMEPERSKLLTFLCIVGFIMGAWSLAGGISSAFTDNPERESAAARKQLEEQMATLKGAGATNVAKAMESAVVMAERSAQNAKPLGYSAIVLAVLGLVGVWLMWRLRRIGFWIYSLMAVIGLVVSVVLLGGGLMTMVAIGFGSLFYAALIVLFATQLKHMR